MDQTLAPTIELAMPAARLAKPPAVSNQIVWRYLLPIATMHLLALVVCLPWLFSWSGLTAMIVGTYVFGGLGINIGYHRLLTHRSFQCPLWLEHFLVTVALCCLEDAPASWVATHRLHHSESDESSDPHAPGVGFLWSHIGWLLVENRAVRCSSAYDRYARDVLRDPFYMRLQRTLLSIWIYLAHALAFFVVGLLAGRAATGHWAGGLQLGLSLVAWGVVLRTVCVWHITWSINSLTHLFGYQSYQTGDNSKNNWLVALISNGEGWHNNHHIDPASASNAHRWWEFDGCYLVIRAFEILGLATDVVRPRCHRQGSPMLAARSEAERIPAAEGERQRSVA